MTLRYQQNIKRLLQSPAPKTTSLEPYERDPRPGLIGIARAQLDCLYVRQGGFADPRCNEPWQMVRAMEAMVSEAYDEDPDEEVQIDRTFNHFLRQVLIFHTMLSHFTKAPADQADIYRMHMRTALDRVWEELEVVDCPPFVKREIREDMSRTLEDEFHPDRIRDRRGNK